MAVYDDARDPDRAGHISRLAHDHRSADTGAARHVAKDVALNAQKARESDVSVNARARADSGIGEAP